MSKETLATVIILSIFFGLCFISYIYKLFWKKKCRARIKELCKTEIVCDSKTFKANYQDFLATCPKGIKDSPGVYMFYDAGEDKYYISSAVNVFKRVQNHINGKYNGYASSDPNVCDKYEITIYLCEKKELSDLTEYLRDKYKATTAYHTTIG